MALLLMVMAFCVEEITSWTGHQQGTPLRALNKQLMTHDDDDVDRAVGDVITYMLSCTALPGHAVNSTGMCAQPTSMR